MYPVIFEIGSFTLRSYGLMAALGFLAGVSAAMLNRKYAKLTTDQLSTICFGAIVAGIAGSRMFYVIQYQHEFKGNFMGVFRIDQGGLVYYGGFFLAMLFIFLYCRRNKLTVLRVMDICAPGLALGHMFGRIGCFLNGCCFGHPGGGFLGVVYPPGSAPFYKYGDVALHPVQLYEAGMNLVMFPVLFYLVRRFKAGIATSTYLIAYGVIRFIDEFFRGDHSSPFFLGMTRAQTIGLVMIPAGAALLIWCIKRNKESQDATSTDSGK